MTPEAEPDLRGAASALKAISHTIRIQYTLETG